MVNSPRKPTFEECYPEIARIVESRRIKWTLSSIRWIDYDDVKSIIITHIWKKFHLLDASRPLAPWVSTIVNNQISNLIRNHYSSFSRPCLSCEANEGENSCAIYGTQDVQCPLYAKWCKTRKRAYDVKLPLDMHAHEQEVHDMPHQSLNIDLAISQFSDRMKRELKPLEYRVYHLIYIEHKTDEDVAEALGYKTSEKNRIGGYRTIYVIKKKIIEKAKTMLRNNEIDY
jgi:hypothetical protein